MQVTIPILKEMFKECNKTYFENKLKMCNFSLYSSTTEKGRFTTGRIWINKRLSWTEETLKGVLIHEMVHYYVDNIIGENNFLFPHGYKFRKVCSNIKKKYGYEVPMSDPIYRYSILKQKESLTITERLEILCLGPINYLLSWIF